MSDHATEAQGLEASAGVMQSSAHLKSRLVSLLMHLPNSQSHLSLWFEEIYQTESTLPADALYQILVRNLCQLIFDFTNFQRRMSIKLQENPILYTNLYCIPSVWDWLQHIARGDNLNESKNMHILDDANNWLSQIFSRNILSAESQLPGISFHLFEFPPK